MIDIINVLFVCFQLFEPLFPYIHQISTNAGMERITAQKIQTVPIPRGHTTVLVRMDFKGMTLMFIVVVSVRNL